MVQYIYTLGVAGERKSVTELDRTVEYSYDSLYRLTSETITEGEKTTVYTYAYDNVSNRILKTENGAATEYVYNALNQLVSDSETTYEYDLNGNLVRVIGTANSALYEYNTENKLVKAIVQNDILVTEESYTYDYQGNRTSKTTHRSDGVTEYVKYINDNSSLTNVLAEIGSEGSVQAYYTIGADLISQERDGKVSVYLYDGHGSVVGLANESGVVTDTYCYDAFGNLLNSTGSTKNCYRYCGEQFDETTGLYYLRARYMDTSTGRFISQDTYQGTINDPVSLHKYLYCNSDPVNNIDPSGYSTKEKEITQTVILLPAFFLTIGYIAEHKYNEQVIRQGISIIRALQVLKPLIVYTSIWGAAISAMMPDIISGDSTSLDTSEKILETVIDNTLQKTKKDDKRPRRTLYHYTNKSGLDAILILGYIKPSIKADNPKDARAGDGQYFSDILPETTTPMRLAIKFKHVANKYLYTHYIEVDVTGLIMIEYKLNLFVHNSTLPLDIRKRVVRFGKV